MARTLLYLAGLLLAAAPAGVGVGVWLAAGTGVAVAVGSALYGLLGWWALTADLLPDPTGEAAR